ncbi:MAG: DUF1569 domain-containing protein [Crocinitomicaceae bacterium]|nr:DUF1569 domain-containing protein [Crocinitomicaceae bacterium]
MALPNIFTKEVTEQLISRINKLTPESQPQWGKMNVAQMFAHCCVSYEMAFENKHPKPGGFVRLMLKLFVKNAVVSEKPYPKSIRTAPAFLISDGRIFETEKKRLIDYLNMTFEKGEKYFDGKESLSFGVLNLTEWNNLFYKHMDHHLKQFGV